VKFCDSGETLAAVESRCGPEHGWADPTDLCSGILELFTDDDSSKKKTAEAFVAWYPRLVSRPHMDRGAEEVTLLGCERANERRLGHNLGLLISSRILLDRTDGAKGTCIL